MLLIPVTTAIYFLEIVAELKLWALPNLVSAPATWENVDLVRAKLATSRYSFSSHEA